MASRKLSDADKREILELYRRPEETTLTLASRYGVSNSTISRFLKSTLPADEYEVLIQQKRASRSPAGASDKPEEKPAPQTSEAAESSEAPEPSEAPETGDRTERKPLPALPTPRPRRPVPKRVVADESNRRSLEEAPRQLELTPIAAIPEPQNLPEEMREAFGEVEDEDEGGMVSWVDEDLMESEDDLGDLDDDDEDDYDDFDEEPDDRTPFFKERDASSLVNVLPLSEALLPRVCYLVVDRASELIARPLRDFGDLGTIPKPEYDQKTLPVFDNHRVARRFASRHHRICKVPDAKVLHKVGSSLQAKGITRLLINGKVYAL